MVCVTIGQCFVVEKKRGARSSVQNWQRKERVIKSGGNETKKPRTQKRPPRPAGGGAKACDKAGACTARGARRVMHGKRIRRGGRQSQAGVTKGAGLKLRASWCVASPIGGPAQHTRRFCVVCGATICYGVNGRPRWGRKGVADGGSDPIKSTFVLLQLLFFPLSLSHSFFPAQRV